MFERLASRERRRSILKDIRKTQELLDPSSSRFVTGTAEEQEEARREWRRHMLIREVVRSDRVEIPRAELVSRRFGILEHESTGSYDRAVGGDPQFLRHAEWYFVTEAGDVLLLERPSSGPQSRQELEQLEADREARRNTPKLKPAWMTEAK